MTTRPPTIAVAIATRGRAAEVGTLVRHLESSTLLPTRIIIVGAAAGDWAGVGSDVFGDRLERVVAPAPGLTRQRNVAVDLLLGVPDEAPDAIVFFDDDFRPHPRWLEHAARLMSERHDIVGVTGEVLIDGAKSAAIDENVADIAIRRWRDEDAGPARRASSLYGCNMAWRTSVFATCRFDERLPLYGWLEDLDFSGQAARIGRLIHAPRCVGVHLGAKGARVSGSRYGYSQIVNPIHLAQRRTCSIPTAAVFVARALASNALRSIIGHPLFDYRGRVRGNVRALIDLAAGRAHPERILQI